jgi:DNA modification methylase
MIYHGNCLDILPTIPDSSVDAIITDPPYPEIDRPYGKLTVAEWQSLMQGIVEHSRRVLKPTGSAVFILQPNSERVGRMRTWLWEFMAWIGKEWNIVQDAYWWNFTAAPTVHCQRHFGLMRSSVKTCVWAGPADCYRNQEEVLWAQSEANAAANRSDRCLKKHPSGQSMRPGRIAAVADERGGVTPFNLLPIANADSKTSGGSFGHGASTPLSLCEWWVKYISPLGGTILDPFSGSGTVGVAALKHNRQYIGIEQNAEYVTISRKRINEKVSA